MPALTSGIVIGVVWKYLFSGDRYGLINYLLMKLGILHEPFLWLQDTRTILPIIIFVQLWMSTGLGFLAMLGGLQNVPHELYEAGAIDGVKNRWQQVWYITIPYIKPQLLFSAVLQVVSSFNVSSITAELAGMPSPNYAGHTIMNHMSDYAFIRYEMGYASAISVVLFLVMIGLNRFIFKWLGSD
jgi:multiple sugar transport system permease protein